MYDKMHQLFYDPPWYGRNSSIILLIVLALVWSKNSTLSFSKDFKTPD